jgi:hypothetical protein
MFPRLMFVFSALLLGTPVARALVHEVTLTNFDAGTPGLYTGGTSFDHGGPGAFVDGVLFAAPLSGRLAIELAFYPLPGIPASANFFQLVALDGSPTSVTGNVVLLGPLDIAAGDHVLNVLGAATIPHTGASVEPRGQYSVRLALAPIPESSTSLLMLGGLAVGACVARRTKVK